MNKLNIVYEDNNILVINKPAGLTVHEGIRTEKTLVDFLIEYCPEIRNVGDSSFRYTQDKLTSSGQDNLRPGIVHRLDKNTSGLMVIAKNNRSFKFLKNQFKERRIEKKYLVLVCGIVKNKEGIINSYIGRMGDKQISVKSEEEIEHRKAKIKNLKKATTEYKVLKYLDGHTLCEAMPKTGRMHQIRVHFKSIGHPVAGDLKYGLKNCSCLDNRILRQFLHAKYLSFSLPNGKRMAFEVDLPEDLQNILSDLENND